MIFTKKKKDKSYDGYWNILVVDDEEEVHSITNIVLKNFVFNNKKIKVYDTYNIEDTKEILQSGIDFALIFLDIVMESDDAGLILTRFVRNNLKNDITRIILRTGQPGNAPEQKIIIDYDINDYKEKTELTATKLTTSVVSSLRSYQELLKIKDHAKILKEQVDEGILELRKKDKMLQHQERICQNVEIINMLAHQWRLPLNDITMNINNMILDIELEDINKESFKNTSDLVLNKAKQLSDQIDSFLTHHQPDSKKNDVTLSEIIDNVFKVVDHKIVENNINVNTNYDGNICIHIFKNEIERILVHLITNSIESYIRNTITNPTLDLQIEINDHRLLFSLKDEAGGIDEHILEQIFDPYFSTKKEISGAGLGLYMSRLLVEKHLNGELEITNTSNGCIAHLSIAVQECGKHG